MHTQLAENKLSHVKIIENGSLLSKLSNVNEDPLKSSRVCKFNTATKLCNYHVTLRKQAQKDFSHQLTL